MFIIKNGEIINGAGVPGFKADILIKGDTISAIGNSFSVSRAKIIDAREAYVMPGFIDVHTDSDHYLTLFTDPLQDDFLRQGVTSIIGGQCGASLAPLLTGSLESIRKWADTNAVNLGWRTIAEFISALEKRKLGVNFGTLIGHGTIRRGFTGNAERDLTSRELGVFEHIIEESMRAGALGLSTGLGYAHGRGVPYSEVKTLVKILGKTGGVYATHLRNEENHVVAAVEEAITLARETSVPTIVSHYKPARGYEDAYSEGFKLIEESHKDTPLWFTSSPSGENLTPIYMLLPAWARAGRLEDMQNLITRPEIRARIASESKNIKGKDIRIAQSSHAPYLVGKTIADIARSMDVGDGAGLVRAMETTALRAVVLQKNINVDFAIQSLRSRRALIGSNMPSLRETSLRDGNDRASIFPEYLRLTEYLGYMPLREAVERITSTPARLFGLRGRGALREGYKADLVIMKNGKICDVFVNGFHVVEDGTVRNIYAGEVLRKQN